jgi:hypothetical protein
VPSTSASSPLLSKEPETLRSYRTPPSRTKLTKRPYPGRFKFICLAGKKLTMSGRQEKGSGLKNKIQSSVFKQYAKQQVRDYMLPMLFLRRFYNESNIITGR